MAITSMSTYQIYVTAGMDEKQRYSYKPKTERHSYGGEKIVDTVVSTLPREQNISSSLCLSGGPSGYHLPLLFNQLRGLPVLGNSHVWVETICIEVMNMSWKKNGIVKPKRVSPFHTKVMDAFNSKAPCASAAIIDAIAWQARSIINGEFASFEPNNHSRS